MYAHEIGSIRGDPHVDEDTVPRVLSGTAPTGGTTGCVGRNGARWALLQGRKEEWQRSTPSPRHPTLQDSGCKVATATWHCSPATLSRQHNDIHCQELECLGPHTTGHSDIIMTSQAVWACTHTPIGPIPGPPPPCGMQKVLCRFRWDTSLP